MAPQAAEVRTPYVAIRGFGYKGQQQKPSDLLQERKVGEPVALTHATYPMGIASAWLPILSSTAFPRAGRGCGRRACVIESLEREGGQQRQMVRSDPGRRRRDSLQ